MAQPRLDLGFNQAGQPMQSNADGLVSLSLGGTPISLDSERKIAAYIQTANGQPPNEPGPPRTNEAQAMPPQVDHNEIARVNKLRSDFAVSLTLISDGEFAAQLRSKTVSSDPVHNNGQGEIRTKTMATIRSEWQPTLYHLTDVG